VIIVNGESLNVNGAFRHNSCLRVSMSHEPWPKLTCSMCKTIAFQTNFCLRVIREDEVVEKKDHGVLRVGDVLGICHFLN